tara:strand:+ start:3384 stop:4649 length:1266 start_codon:yes stop_codon:yes gene_type:complete
MTSLLIDFGASRIKSIIYNIGQSEYINMCSTAGPAQYGMNKVKLSFFYDALQEHIKFHKKYIDQVDAIYLCTEMHGYALVQEDNNFIDDFYYSWRSNESINVKNEEVALFPSKDFKSITGMLPRPGLPVFSLLKHKNFNKKAIFKTLPEIIIDLNGKSNGKTSLSIAAATGLYDINKKCWIEQFSSHTNITFPDVVSGLNESFGYVMLNKNKIPVYACIGDLQSCIISIEREPCDININLGTGSQVSIISNDYKYLLPEIRPLYDGKVFSTLTHIPCGRALSLFSRVLDLKNEWFWETFYSPSDSKNSRKLEIDLNVFPGSYKYKNGGFITKINELDFDKKILIDNIKFSLLEQYTDIINQIIMKNKNLDRIIITGGLANKISDIQNIFSNNIHNKVKIILPKYTIDSTLAGLTQVLNYNS